MPSYRYVEENGLAAMMLAGAASGVNLREHITCRPPPNVNKAANSGFETQRRCPKRVSMAPQKDFCPPKILFKKKEINLNQFSFKICSM